MKKIVINFSALVILLTGLGFISIFSSDNTALAQSNCPKVSYLRLDTDTWNEFVPISEGVCLVYEFSATYITCSGVGTISCCDTGIIDIEVNDVGYTPCP